MPGKLLAAGAVIAGLFAVLLGLLFSPIPSNFGLYRWLASRDPSLVGLTPHFLAINDNDDTSSKTPNRGQAAWGYTFEQLYHSSKKNDLTGQTAIVTGANSGVGFEIALALARLRASVTMACRNAQRCEAAAAMIRSDKAVMKNRNRVVTMTLDTSSLQSVQTFAKNYLEAAKAKANDVDSAAASLDMLFLNAGVGSVGFQEDGSAPLSPDGIELVFATNHVGHHLLYKLLEPLVLNSKMARIVLTSSGASFTTFDYKVATDLETLNAVNVRRDNLKIYGQSKLAQILFCKELTRRLGGQNAANNVYANAAHPGAVNTAIWDKNPMIPQFIQSFIMYLRENIMWNAAEGALTLLYLGVATEQLVEKQVRGNYFHPQSQEVINPLALDEALQKKVWEFSDELVKDFVSKLLVLESLV